MKILEEVAKNLEPDDIVEYKSSIVNYVRNKMRPNLSTSMWSIIDTLNGDLRGSND